MKHFSKANLAAMLATMSLSFSGALQAADEPELFYRGAFDTGSNEGMGREALKLTCGNAVANGACILCSSGQKRRPSGGCDRMDMKVMR
jgi:hypothetical protein